MEIKTDDYAVWYEPETSTVFFRGFLRLEGMEEYRPIMDLLLDVLAQSPTLIINLRELEFLNSSGISMLSMFVVKVRQKGDAVLVFQGSEQVLWQAKSLKNLQRLMPSLQLEFS